MFKQEDLSLHNYMKCLLTYIEHYKSSLLLFCQTNTPAYTWTSLNTLGKHSVQKPTPQFGNIASIEGRVYNERIGKMYPRCIFSLHIKSLSPTLTGSLKCQGADIFLPDIWIFLPNPLNFSTTQWRVRDGRGLTRSGGLLFDVFLPYPK